MLKIRPTTSELFMVRRLFVQMKRESMSQPEQIKAVAQFLAEYRDDIVDRAQRDAIPEEFIRQRTPIICNEEP